MPDAVAPGTAFVVKIDAFDLIYSRVHGSTT